MDNNLTDKQVSSLMSAKFEENEINGEKLMQMDIAKFTEVIGIELMMKYPLNAFRLYQRILHLQTKPFECKICRKHFATSLDMRVHQCTPEKSSA